jgi:hypothetical protein
VKKEINSIYLNPFFASKGRGEAPSASMEHCKLTSFDKSYIWSARFLGFALTKFVSFQHGTIFVGPCLNRRRRILDR